MNGLKGGTRPCIVIAAKLFDGVLALAFMGIRTYVSQKGFTAGWLTCFGRGFSVGL
jgi:hypothetical protein